MDLIQDVITTVRTIRAELEIAPTRRLTALVEAATADQERALAAHAADVMRLAGLERFEFATRVAAGPETVRRVVRGMRIHMPLSGIVDREKEAEKIRRELAKLHKQHQGLQAKLGNPAFVARADPEVVEDTRAQARTAAARRAQLEQILEELAG